MPTCLVDLLYIDYEIKKYVPTYRTRNAYRDRGSLSGMPSPKYE